MNLSKKFPGFICFVLFIGFLSFQLPLTASETDNPLQTAIKKGQLDVVKKLIKKNPSLLDEKDKNGWSPLLHALSNKQSKITSFLIRKGADVKVKASGGWSTIMFALQYEQYQFVVPLINNGADINAQNKQKWTALMLALTKEQKDIAMKLLQNGAHFQSPNVKGHTPLMFALQHKMTEAVSFMLKKGVDINCKDNIDWTPLMFALRYSSPETARQLINLGADVNTANKDKWTPLMFAIRYSDFQTASLLLDKGADIHASQNGGWTALQFALRNEKTEIARRLIQMGADVKTPNKDNWTPLLLAIRNKQPENAKLIISKGADVNAPNNEGWTPLLLALEYSSEDLSLYLLQNGAKLDVKSNDGKTPYSIANAKNYHQIKSIIKKETLKNTTPSSDTHLNVQVQLDKGKAANANIPAAEIARRLLTYAGKTVDPTGNAQSTLKITMKLKAMSANYIGSGTAYSGASISGDTAIEVKGFPLKIEHFRGMVSPPSSIQRFSYTSPSNAPFHKTLQQSGSFIDKLLILIKDMYGPDLLIPALKDSDSGVRTHAARYIGYYGIQKGIPSLINALKDSSPQVRLSAARALYLLRPSSAVDPLCNLLKDPKDYVSAQAARTLGAIKDPKAIPPLLASLTDKSHELREQAFRAIIKINDSKNDSINDPKTAEALVRLLVDKSKTIKNYALAVFPLTKNSHIAAAMVNLAKNGDANLKIAVLNALGKMNVPEAHNALREAMKDPDIKIRTAAVKSLGYSDTPQLLDSLLIAIKDPDKMVRYNAVNALLYINDPRAAEAIVSTLTDPDNLVSLHTAQNLEYMKGTPSIDQLASNFQGKTWSIQLGIVKAVAKINHERKVPVLLDMLKSWDNLVRGAVVEALGNAGDARAIDPIVAVLNITGKNRGRNSHSQCMAAIALGKLNDPRAEAPLVHALLKDDDKHVRKHAAKGLAFVSSPTSLNALTTAMKNENDSDVCMEIAESIGKRANLDAVPALIDILKTKKRGVEYAAYALGLLKSEQAVDPLIQSLKSDNKQLRRRAVWALGEIGHPSSIGPLLDFMEKEPYIDFWAVEKAAFGIGRAKDSSYFNRLVDMMNSHKNSTIQCGAAQALGIMGDQKAVSPLIEKLYRTNDSYGLVQAAVSKALGELKSPAAVEPLINRLISEKNIVIRAAAAEALGILGDSRAMFPLVSAMSDKSQEIRRKSATALIQLGDPKALPFLREAYLDFHIKKETMEKAQEELCK